MSRDIPNTATKISMSSAYAGELSPKYNQNARFEL